MTLRVLLLLCCFAADRCVSQTISRPPRSPRPAASNTPPTTGGTQVTATGIVFPDGTQQSTAAANVGTGSNLPSNLFVMSDTNSPPSGFSSTQQIVLSQDFWSSRAGFPAAGIRATAVTLGSTLYVVGGCCTNGTLFSTVGDKLSAFDPPSNLWSQRANLLTPRRSLAAVSLNSLIYAVGGTDTPINPNSETANALATMETYDPVGNSWTSSVPMPTARYGLTSVALNGRIYSMGGRNSSGQALPTLEIFDTATNTWGNGAPLPVAMAEHGSASIGNIIYVFAPNSTFAYDSSSNNWTTKTAMPTPRTEVVAVPYNGKIYLLGGRQVSSASQGITEQYDPVSDSWVSLASDPTKRSNIASAAIGNSIFSIAGAVYTSGSGWSSSSVTEEYHAPSTYYVFKKN